MESVPLFRFAENGKSELVFVAVRGPRSKTLDMDLVPTGDSPVCPVTAQRGVRFDAKEKPAN